ncbi:MAG: plasmid pRiA4b ORF-3 family protein, partial [Pseudonocardiaceae bacterium]|nr:plasmid pRiA4b ORF-3 family protein [Pseudonocardiaceae bacterium]
GTARPNLPTRRSETPAEHGFDPTSYLSDLSPLASRAEVERTMDRRVFTMPYYGTTIGDQDFDRLNPADPDERGLLIQGEHPEFHEYLADPSWNGELDGMNPRLHLTMHEVVANQLWDNDPPEAWQAAKRLREHGMDRHDILHELAAVMTEHMHPSLVRREPFDTDAYRRALDDLGRRTTTRAEPRAEPTHTTYQIKVGIAGSDPAIWRRLSLPGDLRLNQLHDVIQIAFGWENSHLHQFEAGGSRYTDIGFGSSPGAVDEREATLAQLAPRKGSRLRYTYDFGDDWVHDIVVEAIDPAQGDPTVGCMAAERAGPPEDSGGVPGYQNLVAAMADPKHPDHEHYLDWLGEPFDPEAVDHDAINAALAKVVVASE